MTLRYRCNAHNWPLTIDHLSMWLDSSVDRALHRYRKVMGSNPVQAWMFFRLHFQLLKLKAHCEDHNFTQRKTVCKLACLGNFHWLLGFRFPRGESEWNIAHRGVTCLTSHIVVWLVKQEVFNPYRAKIEKCFHVTLCTLHKCTLHDSEIKWGTKWYPSYLFRFPKKVSVG